MLYSQSITRFASPEEIISLPTTGIFSPKIKALLIKYVIKHRRTDVVARLMAGAWGSLEIDVLAKLACAASTAALANILSPMHRLIGKKVNWRELIKRGGPAVASRMEDASEGAVGPEK